MKRLSPIVISIAVLGFICGTTILYAQKGTGGMPKGSPGHSVTSQTVALTGREGDPAEELRRRSSR